MSEPADKLRRHIEVLSDFEEKYDEFLVARRNRRAIPEVQWSNAEWAERERELRMLAPRADAAIDASGIGGFALHWPQALGGGVKADDLPSLIFDFQDPGFDIESTDDEFQQAILERIPSQIAGLQMQLEEVEQEPSGRRREASTGQDRRWTWLAHPMATAIIGGILATVVGGVIVALILGLFS